MEAAQKAAGGARLFRLGARSSGLRGPRAQKLHPSSSSMLNQAQDSSAKLKPRPFNFNCKIKNASAQCRPSK